MASTLTCNRTMSSIAWCSLVVGLKARMPSGSAYHKRLADIIKAYFGILDFEAFQAWWTQFSNTFTPVCRDVLDRRLVPQLYVCSLAISETLCSQRAVFVPVGTPTSARPTRTTRTLNLLPRSPNLVKRHPLRSVSMLAHTEQCHSDAHHFILVRLLHQRCATRPMESFLHPRVRQYRGAQLLR